MDSRELTVAGADRSSASLALLASSDRRRRPRARRTLPKGSPAVVLGLKSSRYGTQLVWKRLLKGSLDKESLGKVALETQTAKRLQRPQQQ